MMNDKDNILTKVFVDESLTCSSPIESHVYDVLLARGSHLPCFYCGEKEEQKMALKLTDESFPLCIFCQKKGLGAGTRRRPRAITVKPKNKQKPKKRAPRKPKPKLIE